MTNMKPVHVRTIGVPQLESVSGDAVKFVGTSPLAFLNLELAVKKLDFSQSAVHPPILIASTVQ